MSDLFDFDAEDEPTAAPPPRSAPVAADREGFDKTSWGDGPWQHVNLLAEQIIGARAKDGERRKRKR